MNGSKCRLLGRALLFATTSVLCFSQSTPALAPNSAIPGTVDAVTKSSLTISSKLGTVHAKTGPGLQVYKRVQSDLSHVTPQSYVGVTSVKQPDGSERAVEIHVFPETLRGANEGSFLIPNVDGGSPQSTMTNGTMTNGTMARSGKTNQTAPQATMTNGTVQKTTGASAIEVHYQGGARRVVVPASVKVTAIVPTQDMPAAGDRVFFVPEKKADGTYTTSKVTLLKVEAPSK